MRKFKKLPLLALFVFASIAAYSQSKNTDTSRGRDQAEYDRGATYQTQTKKAKKKKSKYSLAGEYDKKVEEYHKRMEANAQRNQKIAKEMEKPQYSDPTYFGHKKPPKKRPPGKKKFCKECGMTH